MNGIETTHVQYNRMFPKWRKIDNIIKSENLHSYILTINEQDTSTDNIIRNRLYKERAVFYSLSGQTAQGMVGSIFRKWPVLTVPDDMLYLTENADGGGNSIYQVSQGTSHDVLTKGRAGLAVTFPQTEGQVSRAQIASGEVVATIHRYEPEQIINWRTETRGSKTILTLVVTREIDEDYAADGYSVEYVETIREMRLDYLRDPETHEPISDVEIYMERVWRKDDNGVTLVTEHYPTDATGAQWEEIPFAFIGSETNEPEPDTPPMLGICDLNIGHYRNSAQWEDAIETSSPQPYIDSDNINLDMLQEARNKGLYAGGAYLLPFKIGIAQAEANTMARQAMLDKVDQMISLGARIMQHGSATKTATQAAGEMEAQTSVIALSASNVSEAFTQALQWVARYMGSDDSELAYTLNQDFVQMELDAPKLQQIVAGFMQGAIPMSDYTRLMRRYGLFDDDTPDEDYADLLALPGAMSGFDTE